MNLEAIARLAGVSRSTVSRVVNGDRRVSDAARERVNEIIRTHNYQPHAAARSLASRRTRMIGLRIPGAVSFIFSDPYYPSLVQGIVDACNDADYGLMLMMEPEADPVSAERIYQRVIRGRHLDGVILATAVLGDPFVGRVAADGVPAVMIGRHPTLTTVDVENTDAAWQAVAHLVGHGYRRIAHIAGPSNIVAANERATGYRTALAEAGIEHDRSLVESGDFSETSGYVAMRQLLDHPEGRPDAVFAGSDTMAAGALRAITDTGLTVPGDIALIGFDGLERHARAFPNLSTVVQPIAELGGAAVRAVIDRVADADSSPKRFVLPTRLELRGSCGCQGPVDALEDHYRTGVVADDALLTMSDAR